MFARLVGTAARLAGRTGATGAAGLSARSGLMTGSAIAAGVAASFYGYQAENIRIEIDDATAKKLLAALSTAKPASGPRYNELMPSPAGSSIKCCVVEFNVPGAKNGGTDKGPNGHRIDSIPIANGIIKAGGSCEIVKYFDTQWDAMKPVAAEASRPPRSLFFF